MNLTVSTGCQTLDSLIGGGIQEGSAILVRGGTGTGKTTLSVQFLIEGARDDENGLYILCEGDPLRLLGQFEGLNLGDLVKSGKITILDLAQARIGVSRNYLSPNIVQCPEADLNPALLYIFELIEENNIKRVVLDSFEAFMTIVIRAEVLLQTRDVLFRIIEYCRREGACLFFISEKSEPIERAEPYEESMADGVVVLGRELIGKHASRTLQILKMRGIAHDSRIHPFRISESGIELILPSCRTSEGVDDRKNVLGIQELDAYIPIPHEGLILIETGSQSTHWRALVGKFLQEGLQYNKPVIFLITGKESRQLAEWFLAHMRTPEGREQVKPNQLVFIDALTTRERPEPLANTQYLIAKIPHDPQNVFELILNVEKDVREQPLDSEIPLLREVEILSERALELGEAPFLQFLNNYYFRLLSRGFLCLGVLNTEIHSLKFTKTVEFLADVIIHTWTSDGQNFVRIIKSPWGQSQIFVAIDDPFSLKSI